MKTSGWPAAMVTGIVVLSIAACDPGAMFSRRTPPPPPSDGQTAAAPAADASQQMRALEDRLRNLEGRVAAMEQATGRAKPAPPAPAAAKPAEKKPAPPGACPCSR